MSEKDNIASVDRWVFVSPSPTEKETVAVDILSLIYFKNNLRIDYKKRLDMFLWTIRILFGIFVCDVVTARACGFLNITRQTNGGILGIKIIFMEQKESCE